MTNYLIIANNAYIKYAKSLIYSIKLHQIDYKVYLFLINPNDENLKFLKSKSSLYNLNVTTINENFKKEVVNIYSEEAAYSANIRGKILNDLSKKLDNITYIDADSIIIKTPNILKEGADLRFFVRQNPTTAKKSIFFSGIISVNLNKNKETIAQMLDFFENRINYYGLTTWFSDQLAIKDVYNSYVDTNKVSFIPVTQDLFDWGYNDESKIWIGKGKSKKNKKYKDIQLDYEQRFNDEE